MKNKNNKTVVTIILLIVVTFGLLGMGNIFRNPGNQSGSPRSTRDIALSCTLDMYTKFHIHPHLKIIINGVNQEIPANVGISLACMHPLHTHDASGEIHVESPEERDFTIGDFFAVWEKMFSANQILDYSADAGHKIVMIVDGKTSADFENLVLKDGQQIVIEYKAK